MIQFPAARRGFAMAIKLPEGTKDLLPVDAAFWEEFKAVSDFAKS